MKNRSLQSSFELPLRCIKKAFSLVEILVALIIVSVIMAALAPVITKKLKSAGITIVGGGSGGAEPKREIDCKGSNFIQVGDLCVTKRNMGDNGNTTLSIPLAASVASVSAGASCDATSNKCCWIGNTADACDEANGGYSGCNRTVCNYEAAKAICESFTYGGKTWRLPTKDELAQFGNFSIGKGSEGLMLCDSQPGKNSAECADGVAKCSTAVDSICYPSVIWGHDKYAGATLNGAYVKKDPYPSNEAFSVRCVVDNPWIGGTTTVTPSTPTVDCSDGTGMGCPSGYKLEGDICRRTLEYTFTGNHYEKDYDDRLKIYLTGTGIFKSLSDSSGELFVVGGGGAGAGGGWESSRGGGGGGYTTKANFNFTQDTSFRVIIGASGGTTYFGSITATGGAGASGSNGGAGTGRGGNAGAAGSDGIEYDGEYFGGGGGGSNGKNGGSGGGGKAGSGVGNRGSNGAPNTGGGGGGGGHGSGGSSGSGGSGGSGVVVINIPKNQTTEPICTKKYEAPEVIPPGMVATCQSGYTYDGVKCVTEMQYSYTGNHYEVKTEDKQKVYLTSTGIFKAESDGTATIFMVGGGGAGAGGGWESSRGGGGGGYTTTSTYDFHKDESFRVIIGGSGQTTYFGTTTAAGGAGASGSNGGAGTGKGGNAGSYGTDGIEFDGEYFGGGGGGSNGYAGGHGGGGKAGSGIGVAGSKGAPNTGGGGGGGGHGSGGSSGSGGSGGSGVVILKFDRERISPTYDYPEEEVKIPAGHVATCPSGYKLASDNKCYTDFQYAFSGSSYEKETIDSKKIYLTSTGIFVAQNTGTATVFLVGSGGAGAGGGWESSRGGGGGGYTTLATKNFVKGEQFRTIIGGSSATTYFGTMTAAGGAGASGSNGGAGTGKGGNAGSYGTDGIEFDGEYFGGGGGGSNGYAGGHGGGGKAGSGIGVAGSKGAPNTGGGGGGGGHGSGGSSGSGGSGGSGVVIIKVDKDVVFPTYKTPEKVEEEANNIVYNTCLSGFSYEYNKGHYEVKTNDSYKIYLTEGGGTFTALQPAVATAFLVGGGGGGASGGWESSRGGGGGGYTTTATVTFAKNSSYTTTIGAGGSAGGGRGGTTKFNTINAEGGYGASGSSGGAGTGNGGNAGAYGNDGIEFEGDYFGGGGGGSNGYAGGHGGGGKAGSGVGVAGSAGAPNTGGGGGGGGHGSAGSSGSGGKGGSGIIVISLKDCPEGDSSTGYLSGGVGITTACTSVVNGNCRLCSKSNGQCYSCALSCPHGYTKDTATCTCIDAYPNQPKSQSDCDQWNSLFIPAGKIDNDRNLCITKWNAGDSDSGYSASPKGATIPSGVNVVNAGTNCNTSTTACCFKGATASPCETSLASSYAGMSTYYSGCNRTVCNYSAAKLICENYAPSGTNIGDWRLPTSGELQNIGHIINTRSFETNVHEIIQRYSGAMGLQFCDVVTGYGSIMCSYGATGNCPGAPDSQCLSGHLHASNRQRYYLSKGVFWGPDGTSDTAHMGSVRCVYDPPGEAVE